MNIVFLASDYPDKHRSVFTFVKQLVDEFANQGHIVIVIAPFSVTHNKRFCKRRESYNCGRGTVVVLRPHYYSMSNVKIGSFSLSNWAMKNAINRELNRMRERPNIMYGHFWNMAYMGFRYAFKYSIPLFVATGESSIWFRNDTSSKKRFCDYVKGVICVSSKNRDESICLGLASSSKCVVIPNGINSRLFMKLDKQRCRETLGFPKGAFIIAFVGWFNERKGSQRVSEAVSNITQGDKVYSVFIGEGHEVPTCDNTLFIGKLSHEEIPTYLNAVDIFVLPTLQEGCCNAIIEAMACGLPIVSSNLPFNKDILNETNSILVDPNSIKQIRDAIIELRDDIKKREFLSINALNSAKQLTIENRAKQIVSFMKSIKGEM